jgi:hypothetical protein
MGLLTVKRLVKSLGYGARQGWIEDQQLSGAAPVAWGPCPAGLCSQSLNYPLPLRLQGKVNAAYNPAKIHLPFQPVTLGKASRLLSRAPEPMRPSFPSLPATHICSTLMLALTAPYLEAHASLSPPHLIVL